MEYQTQLLSLPLDLESKPILKKMAVKYLNEFYKLGNEIKQKIWKDNYYINNELYNLLQNVSKL